jgi:hypothetical protein
MDKIIYNIASYKRGDTLIKTIESIYNQCDIINVTLNDYDEIPVELYDKKINLFISDNDRGDAYKFYKLMESDGYFFTIDDDLIYPENYTEYMIDKVNQYNRNSIITLHARTFNSFPINSFYGRNTSVYHFKQLLNQDVKVQFGGTGVMCFHTDLFKVPIEYFDRPNMADVWIGKYAKEHNIEIICAKHNSGFVNQQDFDDSIYNTDLRNDTVQTNLTNECYLKKEMSVIIPTFDNVDYLKECLDSVVESCDNISNFEILVGIDSCPKTLKFVQDSIFDYRIKFHYFQENVGPYVIKNTLSKISKSENLIFFDSDDVMDNDMVNDILIKLKTSECVKPMYHNFKGKIDYDDPKYKLYSKLFGEGVFGIRKNVFLKFNGFEGWRCAADSDFMVRIQKNGVTFNWVEKLLFYRRIHDKGLTTNPETNYGSKLRKYYIGLTNSKTSFGPLYELKISDFDRVYTKLKIEKRYQNTPVKVITEISPIDNTKVLDNLVVDKYLKSQSTIVKSEEQLITTKSDKSKSESDGIKDNILNLLSGYKPKILKTKVIPNNPKIPNKVVIPPTFKETLSTNKGKKGSNGVTLGKGQGFNF